MLEVLDVVGVVLAADEVVDPFALLVHGQRRFVELVYGVILFVVYDGVKDALVGEGIHAFLLVAFKQLFLRCSKIDLALKIIFLLVLLGDRPLLGLIAGKS